MSRHYSAYQYDVPYRPTYLRNWEVPKYHCPKPSQRVGFTKVIANVRGQLLPGVPRSDCNPFGDFVGTWSLPKTITRKIANQLNGSANKKAFETRCAHLLTATPISRSEPSKLAKPTMEKPERIIEEQKNEKTLLKEITKNELQMKKVICPIHDF